MKTANSVQQLITSVSGAVINLGAATSGNRTLAAAIAATGAKIAIGSTDVAFRVADDVGNWKNGKCTLSTTGQVTQTSITSSSASGADITLGGTVRTFSLVIDAADLDDLAKVSEGVQSSALPAAGTLTGAFRVPLVDLAGNDCIVTLTAIAAAIAAINGGAADTAGPTMNGSLTSSNVTQVAATLTWVAASDNVGVTGYEASKDGGTTWTYVGNVLTYTFISLTAATAYSMRVRAADAAGNKSATPLAISVTTAAGSDTVDPTMSGSLTFTNITTSGYTMNWATGADNVGVIGYETSTDGGTTWVSAGNVLNKAVTGAAASTSYTPRVRAMDAAGRRSNVLSASVTTLGAGTAYTITGYGGVQAPPSTVDAAASQVYGSKKLAINKPGVYFNFSPMPSSAKAGWGTSSTVPPAEITDAQNYDGTNSLNGMCPMGPYDPSTMRDLSSLWVTTGSGTSTWYLWIKPVDGVAQCFNPAGTVVSGA